MYKKNEIIEAVIDGLGNDGEGIAHIGGFPFFIKDTVPGDRVKAKVMKVKKNLGFARLEEIIEGSENRIDPACPVSRSCGGCVLQHLSYEEELKYKDEKVYNCLLRIGGIPADVLDSVREPIEGSPKALRYRNKAQYPVGKDREGRVVSGFYAGHTHHIVEENDCRLSPPEFKVILDTVLDFINEYNIPVYDEESGEGLIRHVLIRKGFNTGEIMCCIVAASEKIVRREVLAERLMSIPGMKSVCINVNPRKTNVILGDRNIFLAGNPYIEDILCGLRFRISPLSFYQVNPVMAEKLYMKAMEYAGLDGESRDKEIWDLCCGIGTITLTAASRAPGAKVHGVEIVPEAIADAKENARINGIENADFFAAAAEEYMPEYLSDNPDARADIVILDPPRKGMQREALDTVIALQPEKIVYVSCDPATLARDLKILISSGYSLRKYRPCDQFARTSHVECVTLLQRMSNTRERTITLDVEMEDYHRIKNRTEVTADATE